MPRNKLFGKRRKARRGKTLKKSRNELDSSSTREASTGDRSTTDRTPADEAAGSSVGKELALSSGCVSAARPSAKSFGARSSRNSAAQASEMGTFLAVSVKDLNEILMEVLANTVTLRSP